MIGSSLGRYRIDARLGEGGMGVVWRAHDPHLGRDVALKVLPDERVSDAEARARLLREARAAAALNHPRILTVYDVGEADGHVYIAMELVPGRPLSRLVGSPGLSLATVLRLGEQIASALAHAHERGIVHRDVKPSNVLVTEAGDAKVLDFGLATRLVTDGSDTRSLDVTQAGTLMGTPEAMAPELWRGARADARSDVWSFGVLLHTLLTGSPPFRGATRYELSAAITTTDPPPLPERLPAPVRALVARCLAREPERRFRSGVELHAAIEAIAAGEGAAGGVHGARSGRGRLRVALVVGAGGLLLAVLGTLAVPWLGREFGGAGRPIESLAVLPLDNFSHDVGQQYFADGMTEELITRLAQLGVVRVISRTSVMRFRGTTQALPEIARQLRVDAVVEGSVEQAGGRVRITAQLVRAATDEHLWASSYERDVGDALALQDEVAAAIAHEIRGTLAAHSGARRGPRPARADAHAARAGVPLAAMQAYLRGRDEYQKWTDAGARRALQYFDQALAIDSTFTEARAARAAVLLWASASPDTVELARAAIAEALRQAPGVGEAHAANARFLFEHDWDWAGSEREFRRAIELNPNDADAHHHYSHLLAALGRVPEAEEQTRLMLALDPLSPSSLDHLVWMDYECGRPGEAEAGYHRLVALDPGYQQNYLQFANILLATRRWTELRGVLERAREQGVSVDPLSLEFANAAARGRTEAAAGLLERMTSAADPYPHDWADVAAAYAVLGKKEKALELLEAAVEHHSYRVLFANLDPAFASLRGDARYLALRRRMGLPA